MPLEELDQTQPSRETAWFGSCNVVKGRLIETVLKFKSPWNPPCFDSLWMISYFQYHGLPEDYQPTDPRVACATDHFYFIFFNLVSRVARNLITGAFRHPSRYDDKSDTAAVSSVPEPVICSAIRNSLDVSDSRDRNIPEGRTALPLGFKSTCKQGSILYGHNTDHITWTFQPFFYVGTNLLLIYKRSG
ncbi:hypothetical protein CISG_05421 [Coccidioides immitis RMSCC 3703]|uniref:Uncharacterized protein n=2 Tax=Coccidioides immitis TaxID=5501 RepID=A0A0J8QTZ8_COCIT|nr:hypothetical protein CIRG_00685 [Coccidioides immitis RMSCC 2394]KMU75936.1 hypothetical protein CISG_05421 [Coccidioides immitis RMSCC 3703]